MKPFQRFVLLAAATVLLNVAAASSFAQATFPDPQGRQAVPGAVQMCVSAQGQAVPCALQDAAPQPGVTLPQNPPGADQRAQVVAISPNSGAAGQYPTGSIPITGNSTGTTGAVVGTLAARPAAITYICGLNVSAIGGTAAVGPITVAGLVGSSMIYHLASTASGNFLTATFSPCIPASAVNTAITITTTADGSASAVDVNSWGFQK